MKCAYCGHDAGPYLANVQGLPVCHAIRPDDCYGLAYMDAKFVAWAREATAEDPQWGMWRDEVRA